ncbi:TonB-dependent receptor [Aurantiacibacter xanthus]|uniref:TonB-dependent receptor n=1 Tax=Aurantiacibacter xanthus TaxID=1784712 RepID=A0A3A1P3G3_9SPHN|nr:TonB-dependent receptor [Aurantiacibacter xanthus]RIV83226.1 TonB-dependent receptor [Aurantiacibacter xanthus]
MKLQTILKGASAPIALSVALMASPSFAQDSEASTTVVEEESVITVTGSRLRKPELESTVPVTNFGGDQIYKRSSPNIGEALNSLPALRSTYSQSNPDLGIGVAGLNLVDLRGLGAQRTLVLVNGRRHVPSDLQVTASAVDINTIPSALVERVEIVTGGNSAIYGSDAIAGVVNFVMKEDYEGVNVRAGIGMPEFGAGSNQYVSAIAGSNFAGGRGNVTLALEYTNQDRVFASDVPWRRKNSGWATVDVDTDSPSDGIPDRRFYDDRRGATISRYGLVPFLQPAPKAACGGTSLTGAAFNCDYIFQPDGTLVPVTFDERLGTGTFGTYIGGNADTGQEGRQVSVYPESHRYVANLFAKYEISPAAELFLEGKYVRAEATGSNSGPAFNQGQYITFNDDRARLRLDNPFLSGQARQIISEQLIASGLHNDLVPVFGALGADDLAAIADGSYRFAIAKSFEDLGIRDEDAVRETYRAVVGVRGDLSSNLNYEVAATYGRTNEAIRVLGNVNVQRLMMALDAGVNPATGNIECRAKFDPSAAFVSPDVDADGGAATLAGDIAACVPYNPFGMPDNAAAANYIVSNAGNKGHLEQIDVQAFIAGDTGQFFELPGGPVAFAIGAEYRRENAYFKADDIINSGLTFANALQTFDPDPTEVKEVFGELDLPLLSNKPFFEELGLTAAGRLSDYGGATGTVFAWNIGGCWSPVRDIIFRANYGKAVRAPNYTETQSPLTQNFATMEDPCAPARINANPNRAANCAAALGANLDNPAYQNFVAGQYSLETLSGANPLLTEESSKSLTVGAVFQPRWVPGLAITVDYYDIDVTDVIVNVGAQTIVDQCYDLPTLDNQFCAQFKRNNTSELGPNGEQPGTIIKQSLIEGPLNFARRQRRGIDFDVQYNYEVAPNVFINSRAYYTHTLKVANYTDPVNPAFVNIFRGGLGDPIDEVVFDLDVTFNNFTVGYGAHYIGPMYLGDYEFYNSMNGNPPTNPDAYPRQKYPSVLYHDVRLALKADKLGPATSGEFFIGVDNLFDKHPPLGATGLTENSAIFDVWGRRFYAGFSLDF